MFHRQALFIAYYFPPLGMAGVQRPVKFLKYLPRFGWEGNVVTVKPTAYHATDASLSAETDESRVLRTGSLDPARLAWLLGFRKNTAAVHRAAGPSRFQQCIRRIARWGAFPDTKVFWAPFALAGALRWHRRRSVDVVVTTGSPTSAHLVGWGMKLLTGIPWVMDQRDYWDGNRRPDDPGTLSHMLRAALESFLVRRTDMVTAVSRELADIAMMRGAPAVTLIRNGFDPADFPDRGEKTRNTRFTIVHGGTVNHLNDIRPLLRAVSRCVADGRIPVDAYEIRQIGTVLDMDLRTYTAALPVPHYIELPYRPHDAYIQDLRQADLLITGQHPTCRDGCVPGKIYEYLATGLPVIVMTDARETAAILHDSGRATVVGAEDVAAAATAIAQEYQRWKSGAPSPDSGEHLPDYSRITQAETMAQVLDKVTEGRT